jgi:hypothetical protein
MKMTDFAPFRLDTVNQCLWRHIDTEDKRISLTPRAFAMLKSLVEHGQLVTQDEVLGASWIYTPSVFSSAAKWTTSSSRIAQGTSARGSRENEAEVKGTYYHHGGICPPRFDGRKKTSDLVMFSLLPSCRV